MNRTLIFLSCIFAGISSVCCQEISLGIVTSYTGTKMRASYAQSWNKHSISGGLQYLQNSRVHDEDEDQYFKRRFYATKGTQHFGVSFNYAYEIVRLANAIPIQISYDLQFIRSDLMGDRWIPTQNVGGVQYYEYVKIINPVAIGLENNICIGLEIPIGAKLTLTQKLGLGIVSFHGVARSIQQKISRKVDFSQMIYAGFSYQI